VLIGLGSFGNGYSVEIHTADFAKGRQPCSLSLFGSLLFAGLALCLKALLFLLEQLVEFDKQGAEFLRILLRGHLCRKCHESFSLFALQMRFS
jgi:hypothetical protein